MKKTLCLLLMLALAMGVFALGAVAEETLTIGFTCNNATNDANQAVHYQAMKDYAEEVGIELIALDPAGDANVQFSHIENFIQMGVDGILFRAVDSTTIIPALKEAHDAGIPIVCTTNIIDESGYDYFDAFVGPSDFYQAATACDIVLSNPKFAEQETINVLQCAHVLGSTVHELRNEGFWAEAEGSNLNLLEMQTANGTREEAQQLMENWLLKYDVEDIDVVFVEGDGMVLGIVAAMESYGLTAEDICVVGICVSGTTFDYIQDGLVYGSVIQSPYDDAQTSIDTLLKIINGEEVEFMTYQPNPPVTKEWIDSGEVTRPDW